MIRELEKKDRALFLSMADEFYHSDAVLHPVEREVLERVFDEFCTSDTYLKGFLLEYEGEAVGFAILSFGFSTEVGGRVVWIEDLYVRPAYRSKKLGREFFSYLNETYSGKVRRFRLEVEQGNVRAISLYERLGFTVLPYQQMVIENP